MRSRVPCRVQPKDQEAVTATSLPIALTRQPAPRRIIVDTDPGIDDAMALLYLHANPDAELHSLTTVFGNGSVDLTTRNASYIVDRFGLAVPVIKGAAGPLAGARIVPELKVHGQDGFGDTGLAARQVSPPQGQAAWEWIVQEIQANPGELTIVAIGPLTNLALALHHEPGIAKLTHEIVIMGSAMGTKGRTGNITPFAEANFFYDPDAADAVLAAEWPVTLVGLDVTSDCILPAASANAMPEEMGEAGVFLRQISLGYEAIYREFDALDGFVIHDVAAAICALHPELFQFQSAAVAVACDGPERGKSSLASISERAAQRFGSSVDAHALVQHFLDTMRAWTGMADCPAPVFQRQGK